MELKYHFIVSLVLSILLFPFFKLNAIYVMVGGFLIDVDHYIWYILKYKNFSIKNTYKLSKNNEILYRLHIFHLIEVLIASIILLFFSKIFLLITIGLIVHYAMDFAMDFYYMKHNLRKLNLRVHSIPQLWAIKKINKNEHRNNSRD